MEYSATETKKYKQVAPGTYTGICYMVCDIGTQKTSYEGDEKEVHQLIVGWELPDEMTEEETPRPMSIIKTYTLSFNDKATLAKDYKAWMKDSSPKTFNLGQLIGKGCNLNIGHTSGGNAKVTGVSALKASEKVPALSRDTILFDMRKPVPAEIGKLPDFIKEKISASPEFKNYVLRIEKGTSSNTEELNDSIPF